MNFKALKHLNCLWKIKLTSCISPIMCYFYTTLTIIEGPHLPTNTTEFILAFNFQIQSQTILFALTVKLLKQFLAGSCPDANRSEAAAVSTFVSVSSLHIKILLELQHAWATGLLLLWGLNCSSGAMVTASQSFTQSPVDTRRVTSSMAGLETKKPHQSR